MAGQPRQPKVNKTQKAKVHTKAKKAKKVKKLVAEHKVPVGEKLSQHLKGLNNRSLKGRFEPVKGDEILAESILLQAKAKKAKQITDPEEIALEQVKALGQPAPFDPAAFVNSSTTTFKSSPLYYRRVPTKDADMILMDELGGAQEKPQELLDFVGTTLLKIKDPVLRETLRQEEHIAVHNDRAKQDRIRNYLLSTLTNNEKIKAMIKEGASNRSILNAMYNLLPRVMPTRKLRHNVDQLDWLGGVRHRWLHEVEPNGYDVEDTDDPDTLPQQRPFTRDEMNRLLQDVEESKFMESDVDEILFAPAAAIAELHREVQQFQVDRQLRYVLKNVSPDQLRPDKLDYRSMREEFKALLGAPPTKKKIPDYVSPKFRSGGDDIKEKMVENIKTKGKANQLSESLVDAVLTKRQQRVDKMGVPFLPGAESGRMDAEDYLVPSTVTNAGLGLMPPVFDVTELPVHYHHSKEDKRIDMFDDCERPFQTRFDIACAVVLNKIMGARGTDIPVYLTDSVAIDTVLDNHPSYISAKVEVLKDLKNGGQGAVKHIKDLMSKGFHPTDVMKRLIKELDEMLYATDERPTYLFDSAGLLTDDINKSVVALTKEEMNKFADYSTFIKEAMRTADVQDARAKFLVNTNRKKFGLPPVDDNGVAQAETADPIASATKVKEIDTSEFSQIGRPMVDANGDFIPGSAVSGLDPRTMNKVKFETAKMVDPETGVEVTVDRAMTDSHPDSVVLRASLRTQEPGIGSPHIISPYTVDLSNHAGIETTPPLSAANGFRPQQKTIYGKQVINAKTIDNTGLASHEVPATRFTTDGSDIVLDPSKAVDYTPQEIDLALDNYDQYVRTRIRWEKKIAEESVTLFKMANTPPIHQYAQYMLTYSPAIQHYRQERAAKNDESFSGEEDWNTEPDVEPTKFDLIKGLGLVKDPERMGEEMIDRVVRNINRIMRGQAEVLIRTSDVANTFSEGVKDSLEMLTKKEALELMEAGKVDGETKVIRVVKNAESGKLETDFVSMYDATGKFAENRHLDAKPARHNPLIHGGEDKVNVSDLPLLQLRNAIDEAQWKERPDIKFEQLMDKQQAKKELDDILHDETYRSPDINWEPITGTDIKKAQYLLSRLEGDEISYDKKFRKVCYDNGIMLTPWDSEYNQLCRRIFDGKIQERLTLSARQATREQQLAALAPIIKEWSLIQETGIAKMLEPVKKETPYARAQRKKFISDYAQKLQEFKVQRLFSAKRIANTEFEYGEHAINLGAVNKDDVFEFTDTYKKLTGKSDAIVNTQEMAMDDITKKAKQAAAKVGEFADASGFVEKAHSRTFTVMDLLEGRVPTEFAAAEQAVMEDVLDKELTPAKVSPTISDFDFRAKYLQLIAADVDAFTDKYYKAVKATNFDEILKAADPEGKLTEDEKKLLKAKTQVSSKQFVLLQRNDVPYAPEDVDADGNERRVKCLGDAVVDVDSPIDATTLQEIHVQHRELLRSTNGHQVNIDVTKFLKAVEEDGMDSDDALDLVESQKAAGTSPDTVDIALNKQMNRYLKAYEETDKVLQEQYKKSLVNELASPDLAEATKNPGVDLPARARRTRAMVADRRRIYASTLLDDDSMKYKIYSVKDCEEYIDLITSDPTVPPREHEAFCPVKFQYAVSKLKETIANEAWQQVTQDFKNKQGEYNQEFADSMQNNEHGMYLEEYKFTGTRAFKRSSDRQYQIVEDLKLEGDDMEVLRSQLTKNIWDPTHPENVDDRIEWAHPPEYENPVDPRVMAKVLDHWMRDDPFLGYYDSVPDGIKQAEVLRSSFSLIPPRIVDSAVRARAGDDTNRVGRKLNALRYNPAFSVRQLKRYRAGLEKYSGIPPYLLDFAEVAYNPHGKFWVHASREENHLREMMTEERLRQPAENLDPERPENSDADVPDISTPITIGGIAANRQAQRVQQHYDSVIGSDRWRRIEQFKKDLNTPLRPEAVGESETDIQSDEMAILQDMFEKARDRILDRHASELHSSDYDGYHLQTEYPELFKHYQKLRAEAGLQEPEKQVYRNERTGQIYEDGTTTEEDEALENLKKRAEVAIKKANREVDHEGNPIVPEVNPADVGKQKVRPGFETFRAIAEGEDEVEYQAEKAKFEAQQRKTRWQERMKKEAASKVTVKAIEEAHKNTEEFLEWAKTYTGFHPFDHKMNRLTKPQKKVFSDAITAEGLESITTFQKLVNAFLEDDSLPTRTDPQGQEFLEQYDDEVWGKKDVSKGIGVLADRFSDGLPIIPRVQGRAKQIYMQLVESFLRFKAKHPSEDWAPHKYEVAMLSKRLFGQTLLTDEEFQQAKGDYFAFVKELDAAAVPDSYARVVEDTLTPPAIDVADFVADEENPESSPVKAEVEKLSAEEKATYFENALRRGAEKRDEKTTYATTANPIESKTSDGVELTGSQLRNRARRNNDNNDQNEEGEFDEDHPLHNLLQTLDDVSFERYFPDRMLLGKKAGIKELYEQLPKELKVKLIMDLIEARGKREFLASRREDIVATVYGTQRQLLRRLSDELQIVKRVERTAFKRIFSLDPQYARQLVSRHLLYASGRVQKDDHQMLPAHINWKTELQYVEETMWAAANRLNARTGGVFPGAPGSAKGADPTVFTPPPIIAGEFAPMFIDHNMHDSADEFVDPHTRLPFYGNTEFTPSSVLEHQKLSQNRLGSRDEFLNQRTTKLNTRPHIADDLFHGANEVIKEEFSQYEFTSDNENGMIETSLAQLALDASTNMAFANAIQKRTEQLQTERKRLESRYRLIAGEYDPNVDYRVKHLWNDDDDVPQENGVVAGRFTELRHKLKKLMQSRDELALNEIDDWAGLKELPDVTPQAQTAAQQAFELLAQRLQGTPETSPARVVTQHITEALEEFKTKLAAQDEPLVKSIAEQTEALEQQMTNKAVAAAKQQVEKAEALKAPTTTDVLGNDLTTDATAEQALLTKYKNVEIPQHMEHVIKNLQAQERMQIEEKAIQWNAAVLKVARAVPRSSGLGQIGTNLLAPREIDEIVNRVSGAIPGGVILHPLSRKYIDQFVTPAEVLMGKILETALPGSTSPSKHPKNKRVYGEHRSAEQVAADIEKIKAGEQTEWTDVEVLTPEAEKPMMIKYRPLLKAISKLKNRSVLTPLRQISAGEDSDREHKYEQRVPEFDNPRTRAASLAKSPLELDINIMKRKQLSPTPFANKSPSDLTVQELYIKDLFDDINLATSLNAVNQDTTSEYTASGIFEYLPMGDENSEYAKAPELNLPDGLVYEELQAIKANDDPFVERPKFQFFTQLAKRRARGMLPSWMKDTVDHRQVVRVYDDDQGQRHIILNKNSPLLDSPDDVHTSFPLATAEKADGPVENALIDPLNKPPTKIVRARRPRFITTEEAHAMKLNPLNHRQELTRIQMEATEKIIDKFIGRHNDDLKFGHSLPVFKEEPYLRSLAIYTGLRKFGVTEVGHKAMNAILHAADIENPSVLYPALNVKNLYSLIRQVEKEDQAIRQGWGAEAVFAHKMLSQGGGFDVKDNAEQLEKYNPIKMHETAIRQAGGSLGLLRDLCKHAEAYKALKNGEAPKDEVKQYHPYAMRSTFDKHQRKVREFSDNESEFENVNVFYDVEAGEKVTTTPSVNTEHTQQHQAMVDTLKSMNGLAPDEVIKIFHIADQQPLPIRKVMYQLLRNHFAAFPEQIPLPELAVVDPNDPQSVTLGQDGGVIRNEQVLLAAKHSSLPNEQVDSTRNLFILEEMNLKLVDMSKKFKMEHGQGLSADDMQEFNNILIDCAQESRVLYPKPKLHEVEIDEKDNSRYTVGFDTEKLAVGELKPYSPEELRFSSDSVSLETFNKIMSLPKDKLFTFIRYMDYVQHHANKIAEVNFYTQLSKDIRAVRPIPEYTPMHVAAAQHVRQLYKNQSEYDKYTVSPGGYLRVGEEAYKDDHALATLYQHRDYGRAIVDRDTGAATVRPYEDGAPTDDVAYNFRNYRVKDKYYSNDDKKLLDYVYRDMRRNRQPLHTDLNETSDFQDEVFVREVPDEDRPEDLDLARRFVNLQRYFSDPLNPKQLKLMRTIYEERRLEAFWRGQTSPWDSADIYNNLRMADKVLNHDTFVDHDRELARLHREIVVGVVREIVDDEDLRLNSLEVDSYNIEPDFIPDYTHYDHVNVFAARRFSPYTTLPMSESNIPPIIGLEQQRNIYNLHLLDPVTFHPRWLARRLNVEYPRMIGMLKTYDYRHRSIMYQTLVPPDPDQRGLGDIDPIVDGVDDKMTNPDWNNLDLTLPNPPEITLDQLDEEYLYSRFAPNLIGRVSWTKKVERQRGNGEIAFRGPLMIPMMFGGDGLAKFSDRMEHVLNKRFLENEQMLDAIEQAAFARFGPIHYGTTKIGELHRPPKLPREIISTTLHPPTRHNWALTTLDEQHKRIYGIMVRDRDGYLRHPTFREFKNIRSRERDRRTPFFWRRHHVMGKLPEITQLFVSQITKLKQDYDERVNVTSDLRSTYDMVYHRQWESKDVILDDPKLDPTNKLKEEFENEAKHFDKVWNRLNEASTVEAIHDEKNIVLDDITLRSRADYIFSDDDRDYSLHRLERVDEKSSDLEGYEQSTQRYKAKLMKRDINKAFNASSDDEAAKLVNPLAHLKAREFQEQLQMFIIKEDDGKVSLAPGYEQKLLECYNSAIMKAALAMDTKLDIGSSIIEMNPDIDTSNIKQFKQFVPTTQQVEQLAEIFQEDTLRAVPADLLIQIANAPLDNDEAPDLSKIDFASIAKSLPNVKISDALKNIKMKSLPKEKIAEVEEKAKIAALERFMEPLPGTGAPAASLLVDKDMINNVHLGELAKEKLDEKILMVAKHLKDFKTKQEMVNFHKKTLGLTFDRETYTYQRLLNQMIKTPENEINPNEADLLKLIGEYNEHERRAKRPQNVIKSVDDAFSISNLGSFKLNQIVEKADRAEKHAKLQGRPFDREAFIQRAIFTLASKQDVIDQQKQQEKFASGKRQNPTWLEEQRNQILGDKAEKDKAAARLSNDKPRIPKHINDTLKQAKEVFGTKEKKSKFSYKEFTKRHVEEATQNPYVRDNAQIDYMDAAKERALFHDFKDTRRGRQPRNLYTKNALEYMDPEEIQAEFDELKVPVMSDEEKVDEPVRVVQDTLKFDFTAKKASLNYVDERVIKHMDSFDLNPHLEHFDLLPPELIKQPGEKLLDSPVRDFLTNRLHDDEYMQRVAKALHIKPQAWADLTAPEQVELSDRYFSHNHPNLGLGDTSPQPPTFVDDNTPGEFSGDEASNPLLAQTTRSLYNYAYGKDRSLLTPDELKTVQDARAEYLDKRSDFFAERAAIVNKNMAIKTQTAIDAKKALKEELSTLDAAVDVAFLPSSVQSSPYATFDINDNNIKDLDAKFKAITAGLPQSAAKALGESIPNQEGFDAYKSFEEKFNKHHGM